MRALVIMVATVWLNISGSGITNTATALDAPLRAQRLTGVTDLILNGELTGAATLIADAYAQLPGIRIYRDTIVNEVPDGTLMVCTHNADCIANGVDWGLILVSTGLPKVLNGDAWMDMTKPAYRAASIAHQVAQCVALGTPYVMIDNAIPQLNSPGLYVNGAAISAAWITDGWIPYLVDLKAALVAEFGASARIAANCFFTQQGAAQIAACLQIVPYVDLVITESYGRSGLQADAEFHPSEATQFGTSVEDVESAIQANPTKQWWVTGRQTSNVYFTWRDDAENALYVKACFETGARTAGSQYGGYRQGFRTVRATRERNNGLADDPFCGINLGAPVGAAVTTATGGRYQDLELGFAAVAPDARGRQVFTLPRALWDAAGVRFRAGAQIVLEQGHGFIATDDPPTPPPATLEADIPSSSTQWLLQARRELYSFRTAEIWLRSTDIASWLALRFETDDEPRPFGCIRVLPVGGTWTLGNIDPTYGYTETLGAAQVTCPTRYATDGSLQRIVIDLQDVCWPFECPRVISAKSSGVTVELIRLSQPVFNEFGGYMSTTTSESVRDRIITVIEALTPTSHAGDKFRSFRDEYEADFETAMSANAAGALRRFQVRQVAPDNFIDGPSNTDVEEREAVFRILVAYPTSHRYGDKAARSRDDVMTEDAIKIEQSVGRNGYGNFAGAFPNAAWLSQAPWERRLVGGVELLETEMTFRLWRSMT